MSEFSAITVPQWGLAMEEGKLVAWLKEVGDAVALGDDLCDIETTKITNTVEAQAAGRLVAKVAAEGETLPVGALIAVLAGGAVDEAALAAFIEARKVEARPTDGGAGGGEGATAFVETRLGRVAYRDVGKGDGKPLLFVHGFGGDKDNWLFNAGAAAGARRVIAVDLPGHGESTRAVETADLTSLAGCLIDVLDGMGCEAAHVVGHSMGGAVALKLAALAPGRVASLALAAPAGFGPVTMAYIDGFIAAERRKDMKPVLEMLFAATDLVTTDMINDVLKSKRADGAVDGLKALAARVFPAGRLAEDVRTVAEALAVPVLIVWGDRDRVLPLPADGIGPLAVTIVADAGHMPHMEKAAEFNAALEKHLAAA